jgi:hypothetical protein
MPRQENLDISLLMGIHLQLQMDAEVTHEDWIRLDREREAIGSHNTLENARGQRAGSAFKLCGRKLARKKGCASLVIAIQGNEAGLDGVVGQAKAIAHLEFLEDLVEMRFDGALADR